MDKDGNIIGPLLLILICSTISIYGYRKGWFKTHPDETLYSKMITYRFLIMLLLGAFCGVIILIKAINYHLAK